MLHALRYPLALVFTFSLAFRLAGQEKSLKKSDVPKSVLVSFERAYPNAKVNRYASEEKNNKVCYELETVEGKTRRDIVYSAEGTVLEVEESMNVSDLPGAIRDAVKKEYPKGSIASVEKVTKGNVTQYDVIVKQGKTKTEIEIDPSGKVLEKE